MPCTEHATGLSSLNSTFTQEPLKRWLLATLAAYHAGEVLMLTMFDRLAGSLPDTRDIADELATRRVQLNLSGSDPRLTYPDQPNALTRGQLGGTTTCDTDAAAVSLS